MYLHIMYIFINMSSASLFVNFQASFSPSFSLNFFVRGPKHPAVSY